MLDGLKSIFFSYREPVLFLTFDPSTHIHNDADASDALYVKLDHATNLALVYFFLWQECLNSVFACSGLSKLRSVF